MLFYYIILTKWLKQQTQQLKPDFAFKNSCKIRKMFCRPCVEVRILLSSSYFVKREWFGFNSLHYVTCTHACKCPYEDYYPYISSKKTEFPAKNSIPLCWTEMTYCATGNCEIKQFPVFREQACQENSFYYLNKMVY